MDKSLIKETARNLRRQSTKAEEIFWKAVRNRQINGKKFQRQFPIQFEIYGNNRFFIADFCCHEYKLVVDIDGLVHERQRDYIEKTLNYICEKYCYDPGSDTSKIEDFLNKCIIYCLPIIAPCFKKCNFQNEKEWRFIQVKNYSQNPVKEVFFDFRIYGKDLISIKEIVLGKNCCMSRKYVEKLLIDFGYNEDNEIIPEVNQQVSSTTSF